VHPALDDAEEGGGVPPAMMAAPGPPDGSVQGKFRLPKCGRIGGAFVEAHHDVGAQGKLDVHGRLRGEEMPGAVDVGLKQDALFGDLPQRPEAEDLIAAAVRQYRPGPVHELVEPSRRRDDSVPRSEVQVIGVAQDYLRPQFPDHVRRQGLHRSLGPHGHEGRGINDSVRRTHPCQTGAAVFVLFYQFKVEIHFPPSRQIINMQSP